jgi:hypothetical protein
MERHSLTKGKDKTACGGMKIGGIHYGTPFTYERQG